MKKLVFICSPFRDADSKKHKENIELARNVCKYVYYQGMIPYAPHLFCPEFLNDDVLEDRKAGIEIGLYMMRKCDFMLVVGDRITEGMAQEIEFAKCEKIKIKYLK